MRLRTIEQFLFHEARLMDEHRYQEWLSLWTHDAVYWVPCSEDADPNRDVSLIYDDRVKLADRATYLDRGTLLDAETRPRLRRIVSNVEAKPADGGDFEVSSNFVLIEARERQQYLWGGRSIHRLCQEKGAIKIRRKKVLLVNSSQPLSTMHFLV